MSIAHLTTERRIALLRPMVEDGSTLEKVASDIDLPLHIARKVADMYGYPIPERMSHALAQLERLVAVSNGGRSQMVGQVQPLRTVPVRPSPPRVIAPPPQDSITTVSQDGTAEPVGLEHLLSRARRSTVPATVTLGKKVDAMVTLLRDRIESEETALAAKAKAKADQEAKRKRRQELKAELAALEGSHPCPDPDCPKVFTYPKRLASHMEKTGHA